MSYRSYMKTDGDYLRHSEDDVSGGYEFFWGPVQLVSHYLRQYHADWLTKHHCLCLDSTHA